MTYIDYEASTIPEQMFEGETATMTVVVNIGGQNAAAVSTTYGDGDSDFSWEPPGTLYIPISHAYDDNAQLNVSIAADDSNEFGGWPIYNQQPAATLIQSTDEVTGFTVTTLSSPQDPSSADTSAGFRYSFATTYTELAEDYAEASTDNFAEFDFQSGTLHTVWTRIFDKDEGFSDYSTEVVLPKSGEQALQDALTALGL